ncbi:kinase-associated protein B [Paenibacillus sp. UNCCL117]|uniref:sporulation phosphorelay system protein KapB n=1 Tax=unclassified Paenibacillus TaxID=185978 RepID=UPI00088169DC|nr:MULTISPECIES: sporulation phosphorelay system protein KapB [unclassified Paenibacillus]SDC49298.1 kinase-associated protein B [Paenibacillus sp. cl123]SFW11784.1 kinase-associated protein B [Paenibacillus sp. UNCCL117]
MSTHDFQPGAIVKASYKTGEYIGEVVELMNSGKLAVRVLAVAGHPVQGDLHHPMDPDVPYFHERPALAYQEIALMPPHTVSAYHGTVPDYRTSLLQALEREQERLDRMRRWAERGLEELEKRKRDYT